MPNQVRFSYSDQQTQEILKFHYHEGSARKLLFSYDGNYLYTAGSDKSIGVVTAGKLQERFMDAHEEAISCLQYLDENFVIASGDDGGEIKIWDFRNPPAT